MVERKRLPKGSHGLSNRELLPVELGGKTYEFKWDARCRVCAGGDKLVLVVNKMLTEGYSYSHIARQVSPLAERPINYNSIRNHLIKHLPAKSAAIRAIIEERSQKMQQDFIEGTSNLVTPYTFAEVMMKKSFDNLVQNGTVVTPKEGLEAAKILNNFIREEEGVSDLSQAITQLNKIISAVREVVPPEMFDKIISKVKANAPLSVEAKRWDEDDVLEEDAEGDGAFDPHEDSDRDEEF